MLRAIDISTSGLVAQRHRMNTIAGNIANANTTRDADGNRQPYQRRFVTFTEQQRPLSVPSNASGVDFRVEIDASSPPRQVFQPGHPDADQDGYVSFPNINLVTEFVNALEASRAYEANISALETTKQMANLALRILA